MIDLHCHILPGVDDGPATMQDSVALARAHVAAGTTTVVATSHVSWDHPQNTAATLRPVLDAVVAQLAQDQIPLTVLPGGELAMTRVHELADEDLRALAIGGGEWLLVECPFTPSAAAFAPVLENLHARGYKIVLAHPERSPAFHRDPDRLAHYVAEGMLTSLTAGAFTGTFGPQVEKVAWSFLARGLVHSVASDAHDLERRIPGIAPQLTAAGIDPQLAQWLGQDVPHAVLHGEPIPFAPVPFPEPARGGLLRRRRR